MANKPLVSVVIPTYNRYDYLFGCVEATRSIPSNDLEIVIQDNTEDNTIFKAYVDNLLDPRIKYYHKPEHISVVDNCDLGILHATGEYICMIGDDDCACESIMHAATYCKTYNIEACCFPFPGFNWGDMVFVGTKKRARYTIREKADGKIFFLDSKKEFEKSLKNGAGLKPTMPRVYHGLVAKECLDRIYSKVGSFFPGPSPDMANAVAVCMEARSSVYIGDYLMVSGYCHKSATGEGNRGQHFGRIEDKPWLPKDTVEKWDKNIPKIFSGETIIAQSTVQAMNAYNCDSNIYRYPYSQLYATFFWHHRDIAMKTLVFCLKKPWRFCQLIKGLFERIKIKSKTSGYVYDYENDEIDTLMEAKKHTESVCKSLEYVPQPI